MTPKMSVLVAGATGSLGREVVRELKAQGYPVRAMARDRNRLERFCPLADERIVADALTPNSLRPALEGVERVFSCLGASVIPLPRYGRQTFTEVDSPANRNLIQSAVSAGVQKFVYVSVFGEKKLAHFDFVQGHEEVVQALRNSGLNYAVVRPTGYFSSLSQIMLVASHGLLPEANGGVACTNPIHEADLAAYCVERLMESGTGIEREVGGPETLPRCEIARLAWKAIGVRQPIKVPVSALQFGGWLLRPFSPRTGHLLAFIAAVLSEDCVAPPYGTRTLTEHFPFFPTEEPFSPN